MSKKRKENKKDSPEETNINNNVWQPIFSIIVFIAGVITLFGSIGYGGELGNIFFNNAYKLFGLYAYLLPLPLFLSSIILWRNSEVNINYIKLFGGILFYLSTTILLSIFHNVYGGMIGNITLNTGNKLLGEIPVIISILASLYISVILLTGKKDFIKFKPLRQKSHGLEEELGRDANEAQVLTKTFVKTIDKKFNIFKFFKKLIVPNKKEISLASKNIYQEEYIEDEENKNQSPSIHQEILQDLNPEKETIKKNKNNPKDEELFDNDLGSFGFENGTENKKVLNKKTIIKNTELIIPPLEILESDSGKPGGGDTGAKMKAIRSTLDTFNIPVEMGSVTVGPSVTRFTLKPAQGVNVRKILNLKDNLQMAVSATNMHIEAPIPGKPFVGIEIPNEKKQQLGLRNMLEGDAFVEGGNLTVAVGKDIIGNPVYGNIEDMPHLLIAGATKSGKSVTVQNLIVSLLYKNSPDDLKLMIIDPKRVEFTVYKNLPHLGTPVITDAKNAVKCLNWAIGEMERRYEYFAENYVGTQNIQDYNKKIWRPAFEKAKRRADNKGLDISEIEIPEKLPFIVIIFDEFNDFMLSYPKEITAAITSLTQKGRAAGIHLVLATQRPDVKVITGTIKANIPARIALKTSSSIDSRTILDQIGAEDLLGKGDMLYVDPNHPRPIRLQAPYVSSEEVAKVIDYIKSEYYDYEIKNIDISKQKVETKIFGDGNENNDNHEQGSGRGFDDGEEPINDPEYIKAKNYIIESGRASTSSLQARFGWGYPKAQKFILMLETHGIIGPMVGNKREVLTGTASLEKEADQLIGE